MNIGLHVLPGVSRLGATIETNTTTKRRKRSRQPSFTNTDSTDDIFSLPSLSLSLGKVKIFFRSLMKTLCLFSTHLIGKHSIKSRKESAKIENIGKLELKQVRSS